MQYLIEKIQKKILKAVKISEKVLEIIIWY